MNLSMRNLPAFKIQIDIMFIKNLSALFKLIKKQFIDKDVNITKTNKRTL